MMPARPQPKAATPKKEETGASTEATADANADVTAEE